MRDKNTSIFVWEIGGLWYVKADTLDIDFNEEEFIRSSIGTFTTRADALCAAHDLDKKLQRVEYGVMELGD